MIGLSLLSLSIVVFFFFQGKKKKTSSLALYYFLNLIQHIRREIQFSRTSLLECFESFQEDSFPQITALFQKQKYDQALDAAFLTQDLKKRLSQFFCKLGTSSVKEEVEKCIYMEDLLKKEAEESEKKLPNQVKVYRTLGICIGGILLLLFL